MKRHVKRNSHRLKLNRWRIFKLKPGRMHDGHQVYGFGNISIIMNSFNQKVFALNEDKWSLVSLEQLNEAAKELCSKTKLNPQDFR
ncbi:hypothetical protein Tco_0256953 [Tanacetum coccineum]